MEKFGIQIGSINDNIGHHAEQYFQNAISENMTFNGNAIAIIEVKSRIHPRFVKEFAEERMKKFRRYFPQYGKYKAHLGIAGLNLLDSPLPHAFRTLDIAFFPKKQRYPLDKHGNFFYIFVSK
ncbi:MAG: hypothetical protein LBH25_09685 [Fibromonadaceae bacterium]|jgi:hypothetical protein|nr:hypothetical protein [Fibromonadaceae bacterium]